MTQVLEGILETALYAADLNAAEGFYGGVLNLEKVSRQGNRHLFYRCGAGMLLIFNPAETAQPVAAGALPVPNHGATGPGHACFRVCGAALDGLVERLRQANVTIEADFLWPNGARSIYFRDPAGNSLECAEPRLWNIE
ncbi:MULTISPECIES: VOC family protein [Alphaproteobacteria]|uniref:Bleomycin resistance protein n=2 Tax=Alphaproteobacteria TaxID=28211 RepID=A0A512HE83_9HYPH|nr:MULTISPECIES: VOC family protein [Alphaproteobacteria]GEO83660.1 bleomycin resistance protein [Ciceribacter naphthalenivorans]GLR24188.1 bleomycin resistance protein [Ciceribacter naphthalenivorans]GLT07044.1 bleomycin resistance protein [Sphingomonas psychrolutea]